MRNGEEIFRRFVKGLHDQEVETVTSSLHSSSLQVPRQSLQHGSVDWLRVVTSVVTLLVRVVTLLVRVVTCQHGSVDLQGSIDGSTGTRRAALPRLTVSP